MGKIAVPTVVKFVSSDIDRVVCLLDRVMCFYSLAVSADGGLDTQKTGCVAQIKPSLWSGQLRNCWVSAEGKSQQASEHM